MIGSLSVPIKENFFERSNVLRSALGHLFDFSQSRPNDITRDLEVFRCFRHINTQLPVVVERQLLRRSGRHQAESTDYRACDGTSQERRDRISDLSEPVPLSGVEPEPVRVRMQSGGFAYTDASRMVGVNWPGR